MFAALRELQINLTTCICSTVYKCTVDVYHYERQKLEKVVKVSLIRRRLVNVEIRPNKQFTFDGRWRSQLFYAS
jgi:hypothetical protein